MRGTILAGLIGLMAVAGATALPVSAAQAAPKGDSYSDWFIALSKAAGADPKYNRIPLNTEAQTQAFMELTKQRYSRKITDAQYRAAVNAQYPGHDYEIRFILSKMP